MLGLVVRDPTPAEAASRFLQPPKPASTRGPTPRPEPPRPEDKTPAASRFEPRAGKRSAAGATAWHRDSRAGAPRPLGGGEPGADFPMFENDWVVSVT